MAIPIFEVQFDKDGNVFQPQQEAAIVQFLSTAPGNQTTDVVAISHGWNNDMDEARTLYRKFLANLETLLPPATAAKKIAIGVLWPSKKFADQDLIPSGAAAFDPFEALAPTLQEQIEQLKHVLGSAQADAELDAAAALLPKLENSASAQREFVSRLSALVGSHVDAKEASPEEGTAELGSGDGAEVLQSLSAPVDSLTVAAGAGGAASFDDTAGGAAGLGSMFSSVTA